MFTEFRVRRDEVTLAGVRGGRVDAPPVLLLHGHPETHLMWRHVAADLVQDHFVVAMDLRGYGDSDRPAATADHSPYSKREMATDAVAVMRHFGVQGFVVAGHDRGGRVAARLTVDHPDRVRAALLLDVAPTAIMYDGTDRAFASAYWHWFFLIQPAPFPERLIGASPDAYVRGVMGARHAGLAPFPDDVLAAYAAALAGEERARGVCEDYRAAATIDLMHDRADLRAGHRTDVPLRVVWAAHGAVDRFDPVTAWSAVSTCVTGRRLECGHYLPEEEPAQIIDEIRALTTRRKS